MNRKAVEETDRYVVRMSVRDGGTLATYLIRKQIQGFLLKGQCPTVHVQALIRRCLPKGYLKKVGHGEYQLTELGVAWCGAANVTKP